MLVGCLYSIICLANSWLYIKDVGPPQPAKSRNSVSTIISPILYILCLLADGVLMALAGEETVCVSFPEENEVKVFNEKGREKTWEFDEVFTTESTQESVYAEVSDLVTSVLDGYNICIFAYGQTGSG